MDEVFDLKSKDQWFRKRIVILLRQIINATYGDAINRYVTFSDLVFNINLHTNILLSYNFYVIEVYYNLITVEMKLVAFIIHVQVQSEVFCYNTINQKISFQV